MRAPTGQAPRSECLRATGPGGPADATLGPISLGTKPQPEDVVRWRLQGPAEDAPMTETIFLELTERQALKVLGLIYEALRDDPDDKELGKAHTQLLAATRRARPLKRIVLP